MNRVKALQSAERMLKQGKVQAALGELQRIAQAAPDDLLTLNRLGDLLARQGRREEAIGYYQRIAERFASGGFYPKAIAIYKKIVRLDGEHLDALVKLGEMYLARKLPREARGYILHAADTYVQRKEFDRAREAYEKLARAEPDDPRHRVRVAEARAAAGDGPGAGEELVELAAKLRSGGKSQEAEKLYRRAAELLPGRPEPHLGLAAALADQDRRDEALGLLEQASATGDALPALQAELALRLEAAGRYDEALERMASAACVEMPPEAVAQFIAQRIERGQAGAVWQRLDAPLHEAAEQDPQALAALLETAGALEQPGHLPAVERLHALHRRLGDRDGEVRALEWLLRIYRGAQMEREAERALARLTELDPGSALVASETGAGGAAAEAAGTGATAESPVESASPAAPAARAGHPAPPASAAKGGVERGDQDFVTGRLTQAEILEKYGLRQKAVAQLEEILERHPEHLETHRRLVALLRSGKATRPLAHALAELALVLYGAGQQDDAREVAAEADGLGTDLAPRDGQRLREAGLLEAAAGAATADAGEPVASATADTPKEIEIDLDLGEIDAPLQPAQSAAEPAAEPPAPAAPPAAAARGARTPQPEVLDEIRQFIDSGALDEAAARVDALRTLGYGGDELERLRGKLAEAPVAEPPPAATFDADDLSALTEALEEELFADDDEGAPLLVPRAEHDQSVDEIFAAFKQQVHAEVEQDDYRTHYDLGIAYKEMGLVDEAIEQFELVVRSEGLYREACSMLAICHRERGDMAPAAAWFRRALEATGDEPESVAGLRYDLAEVLLHTGDTDTALDLFRQVQDEDPDYRDVEARVREIEARIPDLK